MLNVISLGAGVQSSTMALMAAKGLILPMPKCAIFADTGGEPKAVYEHLDWLVHQLPFVTHVVKRDNLKLKDECVRNARGEVEGKRTTIPAFTRGKDGRPAIITRQCTRDYKVDPINAYMRRLLGYAPRERVKRNITQWFGITTDEAVRMKEPPEKWISGRWPLIENRMSRWDCIAWLKDNGFPVPPKSACTFCPYHSDEAWRKLKIDSPDEWSAVVAFDKAIRGGFMGNHGEIFLHRSLKPLDEVDLSTDEESGQPDLFGNECEGMCGV